MGEATGPHPRRSRRSWRRRPSTWQPSVTNGDRFELDRAGGASPANLGASWVSQGAGAIGLLVLGFVVLPFWTACAGASLGGLAVVWWVRAHRNERPWHRRRLRSRPHDRDDAAPTDLEG